jgi:diaminopimelate epimerase
VKLAILSAAGNAFALLDATRTAPPADPARLAGLLCADRKSELFAAALRGGLAPPQGRALDGLLLVQPPGAGGDCRMVIYNADGSRPEACGNGLRCVARFAREHDLAEGDLVRVETDAGLRRVQLLRAGGEPRIARARMGIPRVVAARERLEVGGSAVEATLVEVANPHCVLFVEDERAAPVAELGAALEHHARFPARTNVEFVARRAGRLAVRVWERGVGETAACGTGACAAAVAATVVGLADLPVEVDLPGGRLTVRWPEGLEVELEGPCLAHAEGEWSPARDATGGRR